MLVLAIVSAVAAGLLALVDSFTAPKIEAFKAQSEAGAYQQVLPEADSFTDDSELMKEIDARPDLADIKTVKIATKEEKQVGWVCKVASPGYSSNIEMLIGINSKGELGKVIVLEQKESPGLGTNVTDPDFIEQAAIAQATVNRELKVIKDGGDVQAITGATISSRAVLRGINQVFQFYRWQNEDENP
jgi:electron transport complex protein RnfG